MKVGDEILTIEKHDLIPGGEWAWPSVVTKIENNYVETKYIRTAEPWLIKLCEKLANNHRTFSKQTVKNYRNPVTGEINIKQHESSSNIKFQ
jgi:hypothetical protein